ncbi:DUF397 domain-containing protein [Streptomyces sp. DSM 3412]|uniref:DUF397 domain-containing protein n=1 Tax=Streptomyces gottesmaniae TaxID=3075518 RepID=A0ABU2Z7F1_9ACTN|nr:DUF397 domain-containing protein [Streptomyces sp. DSM 3412]MDT0571559.1 DUF397 domain-containing protein [Streptomyces sp. DSM 3412]
MDRAPHWQKSTYSGGGEGDTCVEIAAVAPNFLGLRESTTPTTHLRTTPTPLAGLLHHIKAGGFRTTS